jgi:hypothetical protein
VYPEMPASEFGRLNGEIDFQDLPVCLGLEESEIEARFRGAMTPPPPPPNPPAASSGTPPAPSADQSSTHVAGRDFRGVTGAFMRLTDFHREAPTARPVYRVMLSELQVPDNAILPPFRWEIGSQRK